jgi:hypothetical protein
MLLFAKCTTSPLSLLHLCPFRLHFEEFERKMRDLTVSWMLPAWGLKACSVDSVNPHQEVGHMFLLELFVSRLLQTVAPTVSAEAHSAGRSLHLWVLVPLAVPWRLAPMAWKVTLPFSGPAPARVWNGFDPLCHRGIWRLHWFRWFWCISSKQIANLETYEFRLSESVYPEVSVQRPTERFLFTIWIQIRFEQF